MSVTNRWLLPDGVDELLPPEAWSVELLRRSLLDLFSSYGYELVTPPLIEYLESLLTGTGNDLELQTFKLTDQLTGRMMGVRGDITPQVARIDAHLLKSQGVSRLCYADNVLHTRPAHTMTNRSPLQVGCELFGEFSTAADMEVISLMVETLAMAGVKDLHIDLAHVGIYRGLVASSGIKSADQAAVFDALSRKSIPELNELAGRVANGGKIIEIIRDVAQLSGGADALDKIRESVAKLKLPNSAVVMAAIDDLDAVRTQLQQRFPQLEIGFDFCELRGYSYHTGVMFAAYTPSYGYALAKGGRYDDIGKEFGESRPATGFSADLKSLMRVSGLQKRITSEDVIAPFGADTGLLAKIKELRTTRRVIQRLSSQDEDNYGCSYVLCREGDDWKVVAL